MQHKAFSFWGGSAPQTSDQRLLLETAGGTDPDPQHIVPQCLLFPPQSWGVWVITCSATDWPISAKCWCISNLCNPSANKILKFLKSKMRTAAIFNIAKLQYLGNGMIEHRQMWHGEAFWPSSPAYRPLKSRSFYSQDGGRRHLEHRKTAIFQ